MPTYKGFVTADVATWSSGIAAGAGLHLPVGDYGSADYRSAMRFATPPWAGWTSITKATITVFISDFQHVGPNSSSIYCSRMNVTAPIWTKAEGSQSCESGFTAGNTTQYDDIQSTATDRVGFTSGSTANAAKTIDVTAAMRYYWANGAGGAQPVFVFDNNGSGQYTELWSRNKGGSYVAYISIDYVDAAPPNAPTLNSPVAGAVVVSATPTINFTPSDPQGDAHTAYHYQVALDAGFTSIFEDATVPGSFPNGTPISRVLGNTLPTRGATYYWRVQTSDAVSGYGAWSAGASFVLKALPVVTVSPTRAMTFDQPNAQPRLVVSWTCDQPQASYRVTTASGYDSGVISGTAQTHTINRNLTNGTAEAVTVAVTTADPLTGSASQSFTPRWGLTVHRRDLTAAPVNWGTPSVVSTVPAGASLVIEYGSSATATATPSPNVWYSSLGAVPKARYVFYRAWFIPSATTSPTLDRIDITSDATVALVDKWGTTKDAPGLTAPWAVATDEYVYGSRSVTVDVGGAAPYRAYSYGIKVRAGRSYILTGLMKAQGNAGAKFQLWDAAGVITNAGGYTMPSGQTMESPTLAATTDWFTQDRRDTNRYKTPTWVADADKTVWIVLVAGGVSGSKAWFDAIKLEESTVATPWSPGAVGATVVDAGGVQVDASKGGIFRLRGSDGAARSVIETGVSGLKFGGDTELSSPAANVIAVPGGQLHAGQPVTAGGTGVQLGAGGIEVVMNGGTPLIDFKADATHDFDARLWMPTPGVLEVQGILKAAGLLRTGGTSFPSSPATGDRFWRTDLRMEFFWDGTRWLSSTLYNTSYGTEIGNLAASTNDICRQALPTYGGALTDIYVESFIVSAFLVNTGGTALGASHNWQVLGRIFGVTPVNYAAYNINSGASGAWRQGTVMSVGVVVGVAANGSLIWTCNISKTGTPGTLYAYPSVSWRYVAV